MITRNSPHFLSFMPVKGETAYPHLPPGLYIFVQDQTTKEVFLRRSKFCHGHPDLANYVNKAFQRELNNFGSVGETISQTIIELAGRKLNDFSWLGSAGEIIIGLAGTVLGFSYSTGYFHDKLKLLEPTEYELHSMSALKTS